MGRRVWVRSRTMLFDNRIGRKRDADGGWSCGLMPRKGNGPKRYLTVAYLEHIALFVVRREAVKIVLGTRQDVNVHENGREAV